MTDIAAQGRASESIRACPCCGLAQRVPAVPPGLRACCRRCGTSLFRRAATLRGNHLTAALASAALVLYPLAVTLPVVRVEKWGHHSDTSILEGVSTLLASDHILVGVIVLLCSIVLPLGKLISLLILCTGGLFMRREHRALTYRVVEWTGRWGMLDVLLVALVVAVLKIGDLVEVSAGPAALAFAMVVMLSLLAAATFDPHGLWPAQAVIEGTTPDAPDGD